LTQDAWEIGVRNFPSSKVLLGSKIMPYWGVIYWTAAVFA
jgi:hypothetical protein